MDQIEDVSADLVHVKNEQCIVVRTRDGKIVLTNPVGLNSILHINFISTLSCWPLLSIVYRKAIFQPKRKEVVGSWRKLHNEELHHFTKNY